MAFGSPFSVEACAILPKVSEVNTSSYGSERDNKDNEAG